MTTQLQIFLQKNTLLFQNEISDIFSFFKFEKVKRNERLIEFGNICKHIFFINSGCSKIYGLDKKGNEITSKFSFEDHIITTLTSFIDQKPSRDCLIAIENSEILKIDRATFFKLIDKYPALKDFYKNLLEFAFIHSQMRVYGFLKMEGIDKLTWVIEHEPKLLSRTSSKSVASYLGMTNSTLSKLKAKL